MFLNTMGALGIRHVINTRALLRLERTMPLLWHKRGGREGGEGGREGREGREGRGGAGGREGERREGERREGKRREGGREGRDDCYTYYSDGTIYTDQQ